MGLRGVSTRGGAVHSPAWPRCSAGCCWAPGPSGTLGVRPQTLSLRGRRCLRAPRRRRPHWLQAVRTAHLEWGATSSLGAPLPRPRLPTDLTTPEPTVFLAPHLSCGASLLSRSFHSWPCAPHCLVCPALCRRHPKNNGTEPNRGSEN